MFKKSLVIVVVTATAVILKRYFVTLSCESHSIHIQEIYIHIRNG